MMSRYTAGFVFLVALGLPASALAATYGLPDGDLPGDCAHDGSGVVSCGAVALGTNDTLNLSANVVWEVESLSVGNNTEINPVGNFDLLINAAGSVSFGNNNVINADIAAGGAVSIGNGVDMTGSIDAGGAVSVGSGNGTIDGNIVSGEGAGSISIGNSEVIGFCDPEVPDKCGATPPDDDDADLRLFANGERPGPVFVNVDEVVNFTVEAENCQAGLLDLGLIGIGTFQWRDSSQGLSNDFESVYSNSVCDRSPEFTAAFPEPGHYNVSFTSEVRGCGFVILGACLWPTDYEEFGSDTVEVIVGQQQPDSYDYIDLRFNENTALTCESLPVTAYACNDDGGCDYYPDEATVSFNTSAGSFLPSSANYQSEANPATSNLAVSQPGLVNVSVTADPEPTGAAPLYCNGEPADNNNCTIEFADARFIFENANGDTDLDAVTRYAAKPSDMDLRAVRKDDATQTCVAAMEGAQSVGLGFECINPNTCHASNPDFEVNGNAIASNNAGAGLSYSTQTLTFNENGVARLAANYFDAGQVKLHAKADIEVEQETVSVRGGSEPFTIVPAGLCVAMDASENGFDCSNNPTAGCSVFKAAGELFMLNISARTWQDGFGDNWGNTAAFCETEITPNFAMQDVALASTVIAPEDGVAGALAPFAFAIEIGNAATEVETAQNEVGVFDFTANPNAYFGHDMIGGVLASVGRFTPAYFTLANPAANHGCSGDGFTYMDQPYSLTFNLIPRAKQFDEGNEVFPGPQTHNYTAAFVRFDESAWYQQGSSSDSIVGVLQPAAQSDDLALRLQHEPLDMVLPEVDNFAGTPFVYAQWLSRLNPKEGAGAADGPFELVYSLSNLADGDDVFLEVRDNGAVIREEIVFNETPAPMRHGRLMLDDTHYYLTTEPQTMTARAEYYAEDNWTVNSGDTGCTDLSEVLIALRNNQDEISALGSAESSIAVGPDGNTTRNILQDWQNGSQRMVFTAPGGERGGFVDVIPQLTGNYPWLQFAWDGSDAHDRNPRGRVSWGIYRGEDNVIHIQEIWN